MIRVKTQKDKASDSKSRGEMVICPNCNQKLADLIEVDGMITTRIKCRRCKTYVLIDVVGIK